MKSLFLILLFFICLSGAYGQTPDNKIKQRFETKEVDRFNRWLASESEHDVFFYLAPMFQYGEGRHNTAYNLHHDFGVMYRWYIYESEETKINLQGWIEQNSFWGGLPVDEFTQRLGMISRINASDETDHSLSIENFFIESFFFQHKWDLTLGKIDPLSLTVATTYSGWDKYNYFSESASDNPVPDLASGIGFYTEFHITPYFGLGGLIVDGLPKNNYIYIPDFQYTAWSYMGFLHWSLGVNKHLFSEHALAYYYQQKTSEKESGKGIVYMANQEVAEGIILILKLSAGKGNVNSLNSSYVGGVTLKRPFHREEDIAGFAVVVNERLGEYEYGTDIYWQILLGRYINLAFNLQGYYTVEKEVNMIFGVRSFIAY